MEHNDNLITTFKTAVNNFNEVLKTMQKRVYELNSNIDDNIEIIQAAYDEIKQSNAELREIVEATDGATTIIDEINEEASGVVEDGEYFIEKMYPLVEEKYIEDDDYDLTEENGTKVPADEEDENDYLAETETEDDDN